MTSRVLACAVSRANSARRLHRSSRGSRHLAAPGVCRRRRSGRTVSPLRPNSPAAWISPSVSAIRLRNVEVSPRGSRCVLTRATRSSVVWSANRATPPAFTRSALSPPARKPRFDASLLDEAQRVDGSNWCPPSARGTVGHGSATPSTMHVSTVSRAGHQDVGGTGPARAQAVASAERTVLHIVAVRPSRNWRWESVIST